MYTVYSETSIQRNLMSKKKNLKQKISFSKSFTVNLRCKLFLKSVIEYKIQVTICVTRLYVISQLYM